MTFIKCAHPYLSLSQWHNRPNVNLNHNPRLNDKKADRCPKITIIYSQCQCPHSFVR